MRHGADVQIAEVAGAEVVRTQWLDFSTVSSLILSLLTSELDYSIPAVLVGFWSRY